MSPSAHALSIGDDSRREESAIYSATICFLIGLSVMIPIAPETRLTLFDVIAVILVLRHRNAVQQHLGKLALVLVVSLAAMTVSAFLSNSPIISLIGRAYQPIALLLEVMGYFLLIRGADGRGQSALVLGTMAGICFHYFYPSDPRVWDEPIKFLIGTPLGVGLIALYTIVMPPRSLRVMPAVVFMVIYAIFCFFLGSRSIGGVYFASALMTMAAGFVPIPKGYAKLAPVIIVVAAIAGYGLTEIYTALAINGFFGDRAAGIAAFQSSFGSIILGGRPEIIVNLSGIMDSPLLGVGINTYPAIYLYELINLSVYSEDTVFDIGNILYHSAIFGTAFESGLIAAWFWVAILYRCFFVVPIFKEFPIYLRLICIPILLMTIWHLLYSPPIPYNRIVMSIGVAFSYYIYSLRNEKNRQFDCNEIRIIAK